MTTFAIVPLIIAAALLASAQDSPTIRGHKIGESFQDYVAIQSGGTQNAIRILNDCAALLDNPKQRRKQEYRAEACQRIAEIVRGQTRTLSAAQAAEVFRISPFSEVEFVAQKLVIVKLALSDEFIQVERDLAEKYGSPDSQEQVPYENGFGAVFLHPRAAWVKRSDVMIIASEDAFTTPRMLLGDRADLPITGVNLVRVEITDRSYAESLAQKERQRPNSLN
jgi:hypothetical protein